ncbi:MAG: glycoside hydrolase family 2 [Clostridia bacterium]|nr:glycoside hydrolase family 2 [Clostridia bacterium]
MDKNLPLNDYPRPQMTRKSFINLNGLWDYAIEKKDAPFGGYQGKILVPYSPETILSGVEKIVTDEDKLYYRRTFEFHKTAEKVLLHFGAVDYECMVRLNGKIVGSHTGGYTPFSFDVTDAIREGNNEIIVEVTDPGDKGTQARGKQSSKRGGIWYTPQSGIWQTVWLEEVCKNNVERIKLTPDIDAGTLTVELTFAESVESARIDVFDKGEPKASAAIVDGKAVVEMGEFSCWSPEDPYLYDAKITTSCDEVGTYFGMRKFSIGKDKEGISRLFLNNKPYFHNGLLDQGYWSDGMYTPASDEAMIYDIQKMKDMGFNMLRKHIKIEPLRWYYHCDRIGMLVWQDMINGGGIYSNFPIMIRPAFTLAFLAKRFMAHDGEKRYKYFSREDEKGRQEYYVDAERMIDLLYNVVSLSVWVPFNEGWGQFDAVKAYDFFKQRDNTRIIDHASGWHDQGIGDLNSFHIYFTAMQFPKYDKNDERPIVLSEFGGFSMQIKGHMYNEEKFFGYRKYYEQEKFEKAMEKLFDKVHDRIAKGLSATVYTEVSDVEDECNGLLSYDRRVVKIDEDLMRKINERIKL